MRRGGQEAARLQAAHEACVRLRRRRPSRRHSRAWSVESSR
jgi:hypothetical protein